MDNLTSENSEIQLRYLNYHNISKEFKDLKSFNLKQ